MIGGEFEYQRRNMVRQLEAAGAASDPKVLEALAAVPRHRFVREHLRNQAYADFALPTEAAQTISQPYVVARMTELLDVRPEHSVLEIGTGSGYQTAILARLARWVYSLERVPSLARQAIARLRDLGVQNVKIHSLDGSLGWSEAAPYDRILVTAGAPEVPGPLIDQLVDGGLLVLPMGDRAEQRLVVCRKLKGGGYRSREAGAVAFVPLVGRHGWRED